MKKTISLLLCLVMLLGCGATALAAEDSGLQAAETLHSLGLFKGTGEDENGAPVYALEKTATRAEALVMLIRLLGEEDAALSSPASHPFTDVPEWADRYVAYAYEKGLTRGVSETNFGTTKNATAQMYLTFVLRALGYSDSGDEPDFTYREAVSYAVKMGLPSGEGDQFLRSDMAVISLSALEQPRRGEDETLICALVEAGAVDAAAALEQGFSVPLPEPEPEPVYNPVRTYGPDIEWGGTDEIVRIALQPDDPYEKIECDAILARFPDAVTLVFGSYDDRHAEAMGISRVLGALEYAMFRTFGYGLLSGSCYNLAENGSVWFYHTYAFLLDRDNRVIGFYDPDDDQEEGFAAFRLKTTDASPIRDAIHSFLLEQLSHCQDNVVRTEVRLSDSSEPGPFTCKVFLNGIDLAELDGRYRLACYYTSENIWNAISGLTTEAEQVGCLCDSIFRAYYLPPLGKHAGGQWTVSRRLDTSVTAGYGQYYHFFVIDNATDTVVGYGCFQTPPRD